MSIDMSQFYQVFFEETAEHLASMESLLLALDLEAPDADQLNAIFRAAHSIKGGSGTFGFNDMTEVTHVLETLLDRIRKNEIVITHDMVDAFLQAGDVLRGLLDAHQNGAVADVAASIEVSARLDHLANNSTAGIPVGGSGQVAAAGPAQAAASQPPVPHVYQIQFVRTAAAFPTKKHLNNLLENLGNIGKIDNKKITDKEVKLSLTTDADEEGLREIFAFFLKPKQLTITLLEPGISQGVPSAGAGEADPGAASEEQGYGFFTATEQDNKAPEQAADEGYGFFMEPAEIKSGVDNAQGYGFFDDTENKSVTAPVLSGRQDENPGRRTSDKAVAATLGDSSIRVSVGKVDKMVNLVGELVITQAMLAETISKMDQASNESLVNGLAQLDRNTRELQESVMSVRMMPINLVFSRFQRVVRDSAIKLNKKVQLKVIGEGTELDKGLIERISDPLTHLVRNSLDHGIESPEDRVAKGKPAQGSITLRAAHQGGSIVIEVSDDGAGLNRERILAKAREKGMPVSDSMSDADVWQMIFAPGFSTAVVITDVSGRGVGMDVVKKNIESAGGRVEINSHFGQGTTISIRLPLTLAILDGLSIAVGGQIYIVPLSFISESLQPAAADINEISGQGRVVRVRGEYLPLIALHKVFQIPTRITEPTEGILVLLENDNKKIALFVDELVGQHQVVIKSLETNYRKVAGLSGATIMGDGRVAMIIDVGALVKLSQQQEF